MGFTCCVPRCTVGYSSNKNPEKVPLFRFPKDEELREAWITAIPREKFVVTSCTRVCAKHFYSADIQLVHADGNARRKHKHRELQFVRLKPGAVPKIFPGCPKYLTKSSTEMRRTSASASWRRNAVNARIEERNKNLLSQDSFDSFSSFTKKLEDAVLPKGFIQDILDNIAVFHHFEYSSGPPKPAISVIINCDLAAKVYISSALVADRVYKDAMRSELLGSITELSNILAACKSLLMKESTEPIVDSCQFLDSAATSLKTFVSVEKEAPTSSNLPFVEFVIEQLGLMKTSNHGRQYSSRMITTAFLWQLTSNSLYKRLRDFFILPSVRWLRTFSQGNSVDSGNINMEFLKNRTKHLKDHEKVVTLLIDEIYTAHRIEYSNGSFIGLTEGGKPSKTVLAFMVQSACGKYKDVVCLITVEKMETTFLRSWFDTVMQALDGILFVAAVSVDNHVCNRYDMCVCSRLLCCLLHVLFSYSCYKDEQTHHSKCLEKCGQPL